MAPLARHPAMNRTQWNKRIDRADTLIGRETSSREVLTFYRHVLGVQRQISENTGDAPARGSEGGEARLRECIDVDAASRWLPVVFLLAREKGPPALAHAVGLIEALSQESQRQLLQDYIDRRNGLDDAVIFVARIVIEPFAERLGGQIRFTTTGSEGICPLCGGSPQLAVLRPEGDGGKRYLQCSFCSLEWEFRRVLCPACSETDHTKLPRYSAEEPKAVRVEACDTCKTYLKSFDTTLDGLLVPAVDEVATVVLDVWATEHGYRKIQPNVIGF